MCFVEHVYATDQSIRVYYYSYILCTYNLRCVCVCVRLFEVQHLGCTFVQNRTFILEHDSVVIAAVHHHVANVDSERFLTTLGKTRHHLVVVGIVANKGM